MYVLKARKGCLPVWEEIDPFEDLEERKVKNRDIYLMSQVETWS